MEGTEKLLKNIQDSMSERADILLMMDRPDETWKCVSQDMEYTPQDIMNVTHIFASMLSTYILHQADIESLSDIWKEVVAERQVQLWEDIHNLILKYSWVNTKTFYK